MKITMGEDRVSRQLTGPDEVKTFTLNKRIHLFLIETKNSEVPQGNSVVSFL